MRTKIEHIKMEGQAGSHNFAHCAWAIPIFRAPKQPHEDAYWQTVLFCFGRKVVSADPYGRLKTLSF